MCNNISKKHIILFIFQIIFDISVVVGATYVFVKFCNTESFISMFAIISLCLCLSSIVNIIYMLKYQKGELPNKVFFVLNIFAITEKIDIIILYMLIEIFGLFASWFVVTTGGV